VQDLIFRLRVPPSGGEDDRQADEPRRRSTLLFSLPASNRLPRSSPIQAGLLMLSWAPRGRGSKALSRRGPETRGAVFRAILGGPPAHALTLSMKGKVHWTNSRFHGCGCGRGNGYPSAAARQIGMCVLRRGQFSPIGPGGKTRFQFRRQRCLGFLILAQPFGYQLLRIATARYQSHEHRLKSMR